MVLLMSERLARSIPSLGYWQRQDKGRPIARLTLQDQVAIVRARIASRTPESKPGAFLGREKEVEDFRLIL